MKMSMKNILTGKTKTISLNNHRVSVVLPRQNISYDRGIKEINKILKKAMKS